MASSKSHSVKFYTREFISRVDSVMKKRVGLATSLLKGKVIFNIGIPVERITGPKGGVKVIRSEPGEYPRKDTGLLVATMMHGVKSSPGVSEGYVGTPLDYGVELEVKMNRSFLKRTLAENAGVIKGILTAPMKTNER